MNMNRARWTAAVFLSASLLATGCKSKPVQNADGTVTNPNGSVTVPNQVPAAATQPAPVRNSDGSITNPDGSVTYPAGSNIAKQENKTVTSAVGPNGGAPVAPPPAVAPAYAPTPAPAPVVRTIPVGTSVTIRTNGALSAHANQVGDRFSGVLERPLVYHGETVFARGTPVSGEVVAAKGKGRFKGAGDLGIELTAIGRDRVETSEFEKVAKGRGKRSAAFTGGGAGLGAIIGGLAGGGKGALIGGLAGAGGGAAAGSYTGSTDVIIPAESVITFRLRSSLTR